jgi:pyruvate,water dikinase
MSRYTFAFDCGETPQHTRLGGKCTSLVAMTAANAPVPPGFAVTTDAYEAVLGGTGLRDRIKDLLAGLDADDTAALDAVAAQIRRLVFDQQVPDGVNQEIAIAYQTLMSRCGCEAPVAVRSSATAEDLPDASFAGQQDTYLWVSGEQQVLQRIRECWASLYTARAITYRIANGIEEDGLSMAVAVQKMVNARAAGVAMTIDPGNGDRSKIVIDASWGLGEMVVSGEVTPDNFVLDKVMLTTVRRTVSDKREELVPDPQSQELVRRDVAHDRRTSPSLSDGELLAVAGLAKAAERHYGCPQDIEWALDADLPAPDNIVLLQARPETVWSRKGTSRSTTARGSGIESITRTLLTQVGQR